MAQHDLILRSQQGDDQAFGELIRIWRQKIFRFVVKHVRDEDDAQDITQQTFIKVHTKFDTLDSPERFSPWIYRIALNLCIDEARRKTRLRNHEAGPVSDSMVELTALTSLADETSVASDRNRIIQQSLDGLPQEQRTVVIMKVFQELTFREIAEILELSENTVKARLYYALRALGKQFKKWNITAEHI